jgi:hypothetical protein
MKIKKIKTIEYYYGEEEQIKQCVYQSNEPILIKIKNFTDKFSLDYFAERITGKTTYSIFENNNCVGHQTDDFSTVLSQIKENKPYRIFGQHASEEFSSEIKRHVPLWQAIPFRPRFFKKTTAVIYFFGGKDSNTEMHFDREHCCNFHLCLSGKKEMLLFTKEQNDRIYKLPFIGDSLIDFSQPLSALEQKFPRIKQAEGYKVILERGDMLFMPRNCWHFTKYLDASSAAGYVFYPKKFLQFYGFFTGFFFLGYKDASGFGVSKWPIFDRFSKSYALATGKTKYFLKTIETILFLFMFLPISILRAIVYGIKMHKARKIIQDKNNAGRH